MSAHCFKSYLTSCIMYETSALHAGGINLSAEQTCRDKSIPAATAMVLTQGTIFGPLESNGIQSK